MLLRSQGHEVELQSKVVPSDLRAMGASPPHGVVIDLSRAPSHGREVAGALRRQKSTRAVPLIFVDGDRDRVARVRTIAPRCSVYGLAEDCRRAEAGLSRASLQIR